MSSTDDPPDDGDTSLADVAAAIDSLSEEQRHELQALSDTLGESGEVVA